MPLQPVHVPAAMPPASRDPDKGEAPAKREDTARAALFFCMFGKTRYPAPHLPPAPALPTLAEGACKQLLRRHVGKSTLGKYEKADGADPRPFHSAKVPNRRRPPAARGPCTYARHFGLSPDGREPKRREVGGSRHTPYFLLGSTLGAPSSAPPLPATSLRPK